MGDLEGRLAGGQYGNPFVFAVPDGDRTVGIQVQHRIIRQAASQLFAVPCLEVQGRHAVGRRGVPIRRAVPRQEQADTQQDTRRHRHRRGEPAARRTDPNRVARGLPKRVDAGLGFGTCARQNRLQGIFRMGASLAQVACDHRYAEKLLDVDRRALEPRRQVRGILYIVRSLVIGEEPVAGLFGDRGANLLVVRGHGFNLAAPCGVCNDPAPGPRTSWPSAAISPDAGQSRGRKAHV